MEDVCVSTDGHLPQGPHREMDPEVPAGFVALRLFPHPALPQRRGRVGRGLPIDVERPDVIVGRHSEADVRLALPDISRRHCRLVFENQHWRVYDLNSLNGVFVNGEHMQEATLHHGDQLQLGNFTFLIEYAVPTAIPHDNEHQEEVLQKIAEVMKEQKRAS